MAFKQPNLSTQLMSQSGMSMPGGMKSQMSKQPVSGRGKGFAAMENALLKSGKPNPKKVTAGKPGRQFFNQAAGGDATGLPKTRTTIHASPSKVLTALARRRAM